MSPKLKIALSIVASLLVIVGISIGTVLLLAHFKSTVKEDTTAQTLKKVSEPENILLDYTSKSIDGRSDAYTIRKKAEVQVETGIKKNDTKPNTEPATTLPTNTTVIYKKDGSYQTRINVQDNVQYESKDKTMKDNSSAIKAATEAFLTDQGLRKINDQITLPGIIYTTYDSENVICQTSDFDSSVYGAALYGVACVDKILVTQQYKAIDDFLALYAPSDASKKPTEIYENNEIVDGNKKLTTLTVVYSAKDSKTLIFAAIDDKYEYIGERAIPNPDVADSFKMSDELKKAISDPKWDNFLKKNII